MNDYDKIINALSFINPSSLSYQEWINVGMALKSANMPLSVWDDWSSREVGDRYHPGECEEKWKTFSGSGISIASLFKMAIDNGYKESQYLEWDSVISADSDYEEVIASHIDSSEKEPYEMAIQYLEALFKPDEYVSWVNECIYKEDRNKWIPANAGHNLKCKTLIRDLKKYKTLDDAFGTINPLGGAWIRFNPTDGEGAHNSNIQRFTYALVESDSMSIEDQKKTLVRLKLPIACLVESGSKSIHAIVKVDAQDAQEYKQRVSFLYDTLGQHGFAVDAQNSNSARLSRLPGAMRNGNIQRLIATNMGAEGWSEWIDHINGFDDDLPPFKTLGEMLDNPAPEPEQLIEGILYKGAKMLCTGDSKSGKTCLLVGLGLSIAEGWDWLGHKVKQGKVLYLNLEVMDNDIEKRVTKFYAAKGVKASREGRENFVHWNLRGRGEPLEELAKKIIRRCRNANFIAIIIDPIYKVQSGDENSAESVGKFCALFDKMAEETGASLLYVHHHSKGAQGSKKAMDRGSGSGVFARDPDAIIDFTGLSPDPDTKELLRTMSSDMKYPLVPLQMSMVLRSFPSPDPVNVLFGFPLHNIDSNGLLDGLPLEGTAEANRQKAPNNQRSSSDKKRIIDECFDAVQIDGVATKTAFNKYFNEEHKKRKEEIPTAGTAENYLIDLSDYYFYDPISKIIKKK